MKKLVTLFLAVVMLVGCFATGAFAAGEPTITVSEETALAGEEVTVQVKISNNPGIAMLELPISYDTTRLEKVNFTASGLPGGMVNTTGIWIGTSDSTYNGTILTLTFKVLDNAPLGDAAVAVSVRSAANWDMEEVDFTVVNGKVTVEEPACEHKNTKTVDVKEATCAAEGYTGDVVCVDCDEIITKGEAIAKLAHTWTWVVDKEATESATGLKHEECSVCGEKRNEGTVIEKLPASHVHAYGKEWKSDAKNHWHECECGDKADSAAHTMEWVVDKKATADKAGSKHEECSVCGYKGKAVVIPATGAELDDVPNTGVEETNYVIPAIMAVAMVGFAALLVLRKKQHN